jgi:hypothetical protein
LFHAPQARPGDDSFSLARRILAESMIFLWNGSEFAFYACTV